jgi:hypothetical protein
MLRPMRRTWWMLRRPPSLARPPPPPPRPPASLQMRSAAPMRMSRPLARVGRQVGWAWAAATAAPAASAATCWPHRASWHPAATQLAASPPLLTATLTRSSSQCAPWPLPTTPTRSPRRQVPLLPLRHPTPARPPAAARQPASHGTALAPPHHPAPPAPLPLPPLLHRCTLTLRSAPRRRAASPSACTATTSRRPLRTSAPSAPARRASASRWVGARAAAAAYQRPRLPTLGCVCAQHRGRAGGAPCSQPATRAATRAARLHHRGERCLPAGTLTTPPGARGCAGWLGEGRGEPTTARRPAASGTVVAVGHRLTPAPPPPPVLARWLQCRAAPSTA